MISGIIGLPRATGSTTRISRIRGTPREGGVPMGLLSSDPRPAACRPHVVAQGVPDELLLSLDSVYKSKSFHKAQEQEEARSHITALEQSSVGLSSVTGRPVFALDLHMFGPYGRQLAHGQWVSDVLVHQGHLWQVCACWQLRQLVLGHVVGVYTQCGTESPLHQDQSGTLAVRSPQHSVEQTPQARTGARDMPQADTHGWEGRAANGSTAPATARQETRAACWHPRPKGVSPRLRGPHVLTPRRSGLAKKSARDVLGAS